MAKNESKESRTLEIRKYQNRRYYDSTHSRHLTLEQIHRLIIEGCNIRVLDAKTNEDITSRVLTQILLEYEPVNLDVFSNELLTRAIRVNDRLLKDFVDVYFRQAFEAFCGSQNQVDQMLRQAHHLTSMLPAAAVSSATNLFRPWMPLSTPSPPAPAKTNDLIEGPAGPGVQNEIAALREEVAELKAQLKQQKQPPRRRQKKNSK
jgi:polyhydroxyalkanoate synthesis repressor PhaR